MGVSHKGAISLGLLYIPVGLYTTTRDNDVKFNQLCKDTKERVRYKKICPSCNKEVNQRISSRVMSMRRTSMSS
jgi:DNA end-binding protein Ku